MQHVSGWGTIPSLPPYPMGFKVGAASIWRPGNWRCCVLLRLIITACRVATSVVCRLWRSRCACYVYSFRVAAAGLCCLCLWHHHITRCSGSIVCAFDTLHAGQILGVEFELELQQSSRDCRARWYYWQSQQERGGEGVFACCVHDGVLCASSTHLPASLAAALSLPLICPSLNTCPQLCYAMLCWPPVCPSSFD